MNPLARAYFIAGMLALLADADVQLLRLPGCFRVSTGRPRDAEVQASLLPVVEWADRPGCSSAGMLRCEVAAVRPAQP
ncbi:hypothetical protein OG871_15920 [Kitasatospora sp. NBC_00374]|uniref:hypothetical protein n=1 Tax=Kitasatospora sp. NBC_00374 TaxID=2975964 RepID=UPI0032560CC8